MRVRKPVVAIELGQEWLKVVRVDPANDGPRLTRLLLQSLESAGDRLPELVAETLGNAGVLNVRDIVACLPRQSVTLRMLELPSSDSQEIADMVDLQVSRQTPYSRDEILYDYRLSPSDQNGYTRALLAIAQGVIANQRFRLLESAGAQGRLLAVSSEGLINGVASPAGLLGEQTQNAFCVIDMDYSATEVLVFHAGGVRFSRCIQTGARHLAEDRSVWQPKLFQEIRQALDTHRHEAPDAAPDHAVLVGAVPPEGFVEELQTDAGIPVRYENVLARLPGGDELLRVLGDNGGRVSFCGLVGMALTSDQVEVNLTPEPVRMRRKIEIQARSLLWLGLSAVTAVVLVSLLTETRLSRRVQQVRDLQKQVQATNREAELIERTGRRNALVRERLDSRLAVINLVDELHRLTPETIYLISVDIDNERRLTLRGVAAAVSDILKYVHTLEGSPLLGDVKSTRTTTGKDKTEFEVVCMPEKGAP